MSSKKRIQKNSFIPKTIHHLVNIVVPRSRNGYRPHLIGWHGLTVIGFIGLSGILLAVNQQSVTVLSAEPSISATDLLRDINAERERQGRSALVNNSKLAAAALAKGKNMLEEQYWAHNSPSGTTPWKWLQDQNYSYTNAGENLAKNFPSSRSTVAAWMASPTHRENMLQGYYTEAGFAIVDGELDGIRTTIIVALFATPASSDTVLTGTTGTGDVGSYIGFLQRIGLSLQSMNAAVLGAISLAGLAIIIAVATFASTHLRKSKKPVGANEQGDSHGVWHRHHTVGKTIGLSVFMLFTLALFGGGQL